MSKNTEPTTDETPAAPVWPKLLEWRGHKFEIPNPEDWSIGAIRAFEAGKQVNGIAAVIGEFSFAKIEHYGMKDCVELFEKIAEVAGFDSQGE